MAAGDAEGGKAGVWRPGPNGACCTTSTGRRARRLNEFSYDVLNDVNHFQVLHDPYAVANSRWTSSFSKLDLVNARSRGRAAATAATSRSSTSTARPTRPAQNVFWAHNLEYFGEDEYMMFDNNLNLTSTNGGATSSAKFVGDAGRLS